MYEISQKHEISSIWNNGARRYTFAQRRAIWRGPSGSACRIIILVLKFATESQLSEIAPTRKNATQFRDAIKVHRGLSLEDIMRKLDSNVDVCGLTLGGGRCSLVQLLSAVFGSCPVMICRVFFETMEPFSIERWVFSFCRCWKNSIRFVYGCELVFGEELFDNLTIQLFKSYLCDFLKRFFIAMVIALCLLKKLSKKLYKHTTVA